MKDPPTRIVTLAHHAALEQVPCNSALMSAVKGSDSALGSLEASERPRKKGAHGRGRNLKDVGDQALMRGLATAFPRMRPGLSLSYGGHRRILPATKRLSGVPLPRFRPHPCATARKLRRVSGHAGCTSWATDHMKPTSSRAMAVHTTVVRLPRAARAR